MRLHLALAILAANGANAQASTPQPERDAAGPQTTTGEPAADTAPAAASAQNSPEEAGGLEEIVVTAQKRSQAINSVGMSINAITGDALTARGIVDTAGLAKVVPGLTFAQSNTQTPVYTLRGIGFFDNSLASSPTVSIYTDEVPLPFPIMTQGSALDLERVEVLKGPQGTLFGQNSTGGAINYIAAKPTDHFLAGGDLSVARFGQVEADGFVSGPLGDDLRARFAFKTVQGGSWQNSTSRDDSLGNDKKFIARQLLNWTPLEHLTVGINLNGFIDKSDTQAPQLIAFAAENPARLYPSVAATPIVTGNGRDGDWTPTWPMQVDHRMGQASIRADYDLSDAARLTSISSYAHMRVRTFLDVDATAGRALDYGQFGSVDTVNQELRVSGESGPLFWIVGANYEADRIDDTVSVQFQESSANQTAPFFPPLQIVNYFTNSKVDNYAAFASIEYEVIDRLTLQLGARYTDSQRDGATCTYDAANNETGITFTILQQALADAGVKTTPVVPIALGECISLDDTLTPTIRPLPLRLHEDNVSWRTGLTYQFDDGPLLYVNVSRGFKAGAFITTTASQTSQFQPVVQEKVTAYETGFKAPLFDRRVQLNGAAFYYDYINKQTRGSFIDPITGLLERLINIPKSRIWGLEAELAAEPLNGLALSAGLTYLDSRIQGSFLQFNKAGTFADFGGSRLDYTPKWSGNGDAQYSWQLPSGLRPFVGASLTYNSSTSATFSTSATPADGFKLKSFTLLDLRAGIGAATGRWNVSLFGRNVTDEYYWNTVIQSPDTRLRFTGQPAIYGVLFSMKTE